MTWMYEALSFLKKSSIHSVQFRPVSFTIKLDSMSRMVLEDALSMSPMSNLIYEDELEDSGICMFEDIEYLEKVKCPEHEHERSFSEGISGCSTPELSRHKEIAKSPVNLETQLDRMDIASDDSVIKAALDYEESHKDLTGDFSKSCSLPTIVGKHKDLKCISPATMCALLNEEFNIGVEQFVVVDCRYPYEFEGGHIPGAVNLWNCESLLHHFFESRVDAAPRSLSNKQVIIFHCEFSSERGPKMCKYLRQKDREVNKDNYPRLNFPEMYILEGGYKAFYETHRHLCQPNSYRNMLHRDYEEELKFYRAEAKSLQSNKTRKPKRPSVRKMRLSFHCEDD